MPVRLRGGRGSTTPGARRLRAVALLGACAALASSPADGRMRVSAEACRPISVANLAGTFTYTVQVEAGSVGCGVARSVLRDAADWPPGETAASADWRCDVGQDPSSWAISCRRGGAIVRAYGPVLERDPWVIVETRARIGALAPASTVGLVLRAVRLRPCTGEGRKWLVAEYARADGATLTIGEGRPYVCANLGIAPLLAVWRIHGRPARLYEFCSPGGCARIWGDYALDWSERGVQINLLTHGLSQRELLAVARSMTAVPA